MECGHGGWGGIDTKHTHEFFRFFIRNQLLSNHCNIETRELIVKKATIIKLLEEIMDDVPILLATRGSREAKANPQYEAICYAISIINGT